MTARPVCNLNTADLKVPTFNAGDHRILQVSYGHRLGGNNCVDYGGRNDHVEQGATPTHSRHPRSGSPPPALPSFFLGDCVQAESCLIFIMAESELAPKFAPFFSFVSPAANLEDHETNKLSYARLALLLQ